MEHFFYNCPLIFHSELFFLRSLIGIIKSQEHFQLFGCGSGGVESLLTSVTVCLAQEFSGISGT